MSKFSIIAFGDSITYGYPFGHPYSWVKIASDSLETSILNQGVNGDTLFDLLKRLNFDVIDFNPEHCIIMGGTNDIFQGCDIELMKSNFSKLVSRILERRIIPIIGIPPPIQDSIFEKNFDVFRKWLKKYAKKQDLETIDFHQCFFNHPTSSLSELFEDGVHPSTQGYEAMAETAIQTLKTTLD